MITVGIESTAHTFGVGVLDDEKVLANVARSIKPREGGIIPREAAEFHVENGGEVYREALARAGVGENDIGLVAFARGPGLGPCLRVGGIAARVLAGKLGVPLLGVNHCIGHIEIGKKETGLEDPVTLYVSGGNTQIIAFEEGRYRIFGETLDIAIGKCIDHFARKAGLSFPGGPKVEELARDGKLVELPYVVKGMDFSFSGMFSATCRLLESEKLEDLCYSLQEYAFAMLVEATERAIAHTEKGECLLTGGVAANGRLQEMLKVMCEEREPGVEFRTVPREFSGDNGAMIAWLGELMHKAGVRQTLEGTGVAQKFRTDEVEVSWIRGPRRCARG